MEIITNNAPRQILYQWDLTPVEREEFDYLKNDEDGNFVRYKGETYDLGEFMTTQGLTEFNPLKKWDGYHSDSFFSGIVVKYTEDNDYVIMGRFYA